MEGQQSPRRARIRGSLPTCFLGDSFLLLIALVLGGILSSRGAAGPPVPSGRRRSALVLAELSAGLVFGTPATRSGDPDTGSSRTGARHGQSDINRTSDTSSAGRIRRGGGVRRGRIRGNSCFGRCRAERKRGPAPDPCPLSRGQENARGSGACGTGSTCPAWMNGLRNPFPSFRGSFFSPEPSSPDPLRSGKNSPIGDFPGTKPPA